MSDTHDISLDALVDADHPWLGLQPFTEQWQRYFFGRTAEICEVYLRVVESPLTVLYGRSGLGKTSLLRAGLMPKLRVENFRPVHVLLDFNPGAMPLIEQARIALARALAEDDQAANTLLAGWLDLHSLWEILAHKERRPADLVERPPVLIFDQFEELFALTENDCGAVAPVRNDVRVFLEQLADVVENRAPAALRRDLQENPERARSFDFGSSRARIVLTLREDFLARLEDWKHLIPSLMRNRLPLRTLNGPQALEAVVRPGRTDGRNLVSDEVGERIVRFVAKRSQETPLESIEAVPPLVSLLCEQLNAARLATAPPRTQITAELVMAQGEDILKRFYEESFLAFPGEEREMVRAWVEDHLVSERGKRNPVAQEDAVAALARGGVREPQDVLDRLVRRRLLTVEQRGGTQRLEITHDVLTDLIVPARRERRERQVREQADARAALERHRLQRVRGLALAMGILVVFASAGFGIAYLQWRRAEEQLTRSLARQLAAQALTYQEREPELALLLAAQAVVAEASPETRSALLTVLQRHPWIPVTLHMPGGGAVQHIAFTAGGKRLIAESADGAHAVFDVAERRVSQGDAESPDGDGVPVDSQPSVEVVDGRVVVESGRPGERVPLDRRGDARVAALAPDATTVAVGRADGRVALYDAERHMEIGEPLLGHEVEVTALAFSTDGHDLASADKGGTIIVRDVSAESWRQRVCKMAGRDLDDGEREQFLGESAARVPPACSGAGASHASPTENARTAVPIDMVLVPAGWFWMGCNEAQDKQCSNNEFWHQVYVDTFAIDRTEVTVSSYRACVTAGRCTPPDAQGYCNWGQEGHEQHPINCVDWAQARAYCDSIGRRLPWEAEWEKAARGTEGNIYPWGNQAFGSKSAAWANIADEAAREADRSVTVFEHGYRDGFGATAPVDSFNAGLSPYKAADLAGNVLEWVWDAMPGGRGLRGGSWNLAAANARASFRFSAPPQDRAPSVGFRCAQSVNREPEGDRPGETPARHEQQAPLQVEMPGEDLNLKPGPPLQGSSTYAPDRITENLIATAIAMAGPRADNAHVDALHANALLDEAAQAYDKGDKLLAVGLFAKAAKRDGATALKAFSGLNKSFVKLKKPIEAEEAKEAFASLFAFAFRQGKLPVTFLFNVDATTFLGHADVQEYAMWLHVVADTIMDSGTCVQVLGHQSPAEHGRMLSLKRAEVIKEHLLADEPRIKGKITTIGRGSSENVIGTGTNDDSDAVDRRVVFKVVGCAP